MQLRAAEWMLVSGGVMVLVGITNLVGKDGGRATRAFDLAILAVGSVVALWGLWRSRRV